jgi:hypothetical protein
LWSRQLSFVKYINAQNGRFACNLFSFIGIEQNQKNRCSPGPGCEVRAGFFRFEEAGDLHDPTHQDQCAPDAHNYVQMREGEFADAG